MVLLSGNDMQKMELASQDGFSNDVLEIIFKMGSFSDSLGVTLVTLCKMVLKTLNSLPGGQFFP